MKQNILKVVTVGTLALGTTMAIGLGSNASTVDADASATLATQVAAQADDDVQDQLDVPVEADVLDAEPAAELTARAEAQL